MSVMDEGGGAATGVGVAYVVGHVTTGRDTLSISATDVGLGVVVPVTAVVEVAEDFGR